MLPGDSWGLAAGFVGSENEAVRLHLLGGPWTRLMNDGFLVDPRGSGFFAVSEEGLAASANESKLVSVSEQKEITNKVDGIPTAFISYSWDSDDHKLWVRKLAERLRSQGVKVILDQWDLKVGGDRTHFMASRIDSSDFVIIVCTPTYAAKANNREGGVGYEAMIITSQVARRTLQDKFIPVLRSGAWDDSAIPIWLQSKIGADLRGNPYDQKQYDTLILVASSPTTKTASPSWNGSPADSGGCQGRSLLFLNRIRPGCSSRASLRSSIASWSVRCVNVCSSVSQGSQEES
jgi:hypothetical protein